METRYYTCNPSFKQTKNTTSTHMQNSDWLNRYATSTLTKKKIRKNKREKRENLWILTIEALVPKGLNQELN